MLTPKDDYSALPNDYHASIQYGENGNKNKVISRHFHHNGQAHHMFSRFLNLQILFTKFSLFCFSTRSKFSIEIKNADISYICLP